MSAAPADARGTPMSAEGRAELAAGFRKRAVECARPDDFSAQSERARLDGKAEAYEHAAQLVEP